MERKVKILDTTLRDGAQGEGISFSVEDKLAIVRILDEFGVDYIEIGNPFMNVKEREFFERLEKEKLKHSKISVFCSTHKKGSSPEEDEMLSKAAVGFAPCASVVGKCPISQVEGVLGCTPEENLNMVKDSVAFLKAQGKEVVFDAEHFFDACRENKKYAFSVLEAAVSGGADTICLCDTNGASFPTEIFEIAYEVCSTFDVRVGIHCHDDTGMAAANAVMAVEAGAAHLQGTFNGIGERCGNVALSTVIPCLQLKKGYDVAGNRLQKLTQTARNIADICNINLLNTAPFVGSAAFAHKAGMHSDALKKLPGSFEHVTPESVGNERRLLTSEYAGRTAIAEKIQAVIPGVEKNSPQVKRLIEKLKQLEYEGYQFETAEQSFELLIRRELKSYQPFFELIEFRTMGELPAVKPETATAIIKIAVGDKTEITAAEGKGPVSALDKALRKALGVFYPEIGKMYLSDYKVRVVDPQDATSAKVRVLITSTDGEDVWTTVGVSSDIIEASWHALVDSIEYMLLKSRKNY